MAYWNSKIIAREVSHGEEEIFLAQTIFVEASCLDRYESSTAIMNTHLV